jgi:hypothetical protein
LPVPVDPALIVIHGALLVAVHPQPAVIVTVTNPVELVAAALAPLAERVAAHDGAAWKTVNVWPAIVSVPVRVVLVALAAAT